MSKILAVRLMDHHEKQVMMTPLVPPNMSPEEPDTPRVCVAQSIQQCLSSMGDPGGGATPEAWICQTELPRRARHELSVYVAVVDESIVYTPDVGEVPDSCFTGEQWLIVPTMMYRIAYIWALRQGDFQGLWGYFEPIPPQKWRRHLEHIHIPRPLEHVDYHIHGI